MKRTEKKKARYVKKTKKIGADQTKKIEAWFGFCANGKEKKRGSLQGVF